MHPRAPRAVILNAFHGNKKEMQEWNARQRLPDAYNERHLDPSGVHRCYCLGALVPRACQSIPSTCQSHVDGTYTRKGEMHVEGSQVHVRGLKRHIIKGIWIRPRCIGIPV